MSLSLLVLICSLSPQSERKPGRCWGDARSHSPWDTPGCGHHTPPTTCPAHFLASRITYRHSVWNGDHVVSSQCVYHERDELQNVCCRTAPQLEPSQDPRRHVMGGATHGGLLPHPQSHLTVSHTPKLAKFHSLSHSLLVVEPHPM